MFKALNGGSFLYTWVILRIKPDVWVQKELICRDFMLFLIRRLQSCHIFFYLRNPPHPSPYHIEYVHLVIERFLIPVLKKIPPTLFCCWRGVDKAHLFSFDGSSCQWPLSHLYPDSGGIILKMTMFGQNFQNSPQQHQISYVTLSMKTSMSNW